MMETVITLQHHQAEAFFAKEPYVLFVTGLGGTALRRLEVKGREVAHQEVLFDSFGRVRDVVTGPDGLLYALTEENDAVAVIVSEESGLISIALDGAIERGLGPADLRARLKDLVVQRRGTAVPAGAQGRA